MVDAIIIVLKKTNGAGTDPVIFFNLEAADIAVI